MADLIRPIQHSRNRMLKIKKNEFYTTRFRIYTNEMKSQRVRRCLLLCWSDVYLYAESVCMNRYINRASGILPLNGKGFLFQLYIFFIHLYNITPSAVSIIKNKYPSAVCLMRKTLFLNYRLSRSIIYPKWRRLLFIYKTRTTQNTHSISCLFPLFRVMASAAGAGRWTLYIFITLFRIFALAAGQLCILFPISSKSDDGHQ